MLDRAPSEFARADAPPADAVVATGITRPRYEDVTQDGRLRLDSVWHAMGPVFWERHPMAVSLGRLGTQGIRTVLTYVTLEGGERGISLFADLEHEVRMRFAHTVDAEGTVDRILMDTWLESHAPARGGRDAPPRPGRGRVLAARSFGRHVLTRPAVAPPGHRVLALDDPELPSVPATRLAWRPAALLELPGGARALEEAPRAEPVPVAFGLAHTDGNQHVNFQVYPRLLEEAALRRLHELGRPGRRLARRAELVYRKPGFAGDVLRLVLQAFEAEGGAVGVVGGFFEDTPGSRAARSWEEAGRPRCSARLWLTE
ncbi:MAG: hypothetical protein IT376_13070 [Polyangiaceae bacterium]|nr:hypothetical protein [Polyangiaceae bacterium]